MLPTPSNHPLARSDLLTTLCAYAPGLANPERNPGWPRHPNGVTTQLGRLAPNLRARGIDYARERVPGTGKRLLVIRNAHPDPEQVKRQTPCVADVDDDL